jgi:hypothetical protein
VPYRQRCLSGRSGEPLLPNGTISVSQSACIMGWNEESLIWPDSAVMDWTEVGLGMSEINWNGTRCYWND